MKMKRAMIGRNNAMAVITAKMYRIRSTWITVFFVGSPLCGLMRTTYRSEKIIVSNTSSDTKSNSASYDIVYSKGPYKHLLQWYGDGSDEDVAEFKFNKRPPSKHLVSKLRDSKSKEVPAPAPQFASRAPTVGSIALTPGFSFCSCC
ncbi:hypothetical protein Tco_0134149 [Tanacetum coccineum]